MVPPPPSAPTGMGTAPAGSSCFSFEKLSLLHKHKNIQANMVAAVHIASKYDISLSNTVNIFVNLMNMVGDQEWTAEAEFDNNNDE